MTRAHALTPDRDERAALNTALLATGHDSGFWDHNGRPAPWPDDIDEWRLSTGDALNHDAAEHPL